MAQKLQLILLLGICLWANDASSSTFTFNSLTRQISKGSSDCYEEGLMCDNCDTVSECIELYDGVYLKQQVYTCTGGSCLKSTGNCTTLPNPECDKNLMNYTLVCRQAGLFPHPFNRCEYFMCVPGDNDTVVEEPKEFTCPSGFGYDAYTGLCRVKLASNTTCPMLLQPCKSVGQRGGVPGHSSMYYICLKNLDDVPMPQLFLCTKNQVYNETRRTCEEPVHVTGLSSTGKCLARGFYYEASSCFGYNDCGAVDANPIRRVCPAKMYFDGKLAKCVDFTCQQAYTF